MLTTLDKLRSILLPSHADTSQDSILTLNLMSASTKIENRCKRSFRKQEYTEKISGDNQYKYINLRNFPVHSILSISDEKGGELTDYEIMDSGRIFRRSGWPTGENNLMVKYVGGYVLPSDATSDIPSTLPAPIEMACLLLTQMLMRDPGVTSERVGDLAVTYAADSGAELPAPVIALISDYVGGWV